MTQGQNNRPSFWQRVKNSFANFMQGRYGTDQLNSLILWAGVGLCLVSMLIPVPVVSLLITGLAYMCMGIAIWRCFSRNTYKRYLENRKYLSWRERLRDKDHKYFSCPKCKQSVRVPKGKGKIAITCPKCREKFTRKS